MSASIASIALSPAPVAEATDTRLMTFAGTGIYGYNGDNQPAPSAQLRVVYGVAIAPDGSAILADYDDHRVRRVSPAGVITTIAGTGTAGYNGDNIAATTAQLNSPAGLAIAADGSVLISDYNNNRVRRVAPNGTITTIAGTGSDGYNGDNIAAASAQLSHPMGLAVRPDGTVYVADAWNHRVRQISPGGTITTVAGTGTSGYNGDNIAATTAEIDDPQGLAIAGDGALIIAERVGNRLRRVSLAGTITTIAGTGTQGYNGEGIVATSAHLNHPRAVAVAADGSLFISERYAHRVRRIGPTGTITTIAGTGTSGYNGDAIIGTTAQVDQPNGLALTTGGDILIADSSNARVRLLDLDYVAPDSSPVTGLPPSPPPGPGSEPLTDPLVTGYPDPSSPGPVDRVEAKTVDGTFSLSVPKGCVRPGQQFTTTLGFKRAQRKSKRIVVKIGSVDFTEGTRLLVRDIAAPFSYTFRVPLVQRPASTIALRARATIRVHVGKARKKSVAARVKVCG